jgi:hypothetical protein
MTFADKLKQPKIIAVSVVVVTMIGLILFLVLSNRGSESDSGETTTTLTNNTINLASSDVRINNKPLLSYFRHINSGTLSEGVDVLLGEYVPRSNEWTYGMRFPVDVKLHYVVLISTDIATSASQIMRYAGYKNGELVIFNNTGSTTTSATQYGQTFVYDVSEFDVTLTKDDIYYHTLGGSVPSTPDCLDWSVYVYYQQI